MKRYIASTGEVIVVEDKAKKPVDDRPPGRVRDRSFDNTVTKTRENVSAVSQNAAAVNAVIENAGSSGSLFGNLFGSLQNRSGGSNLPFGLEAGDIAILALLFFLYRESGDDEFLIILAFFAFGIFTN